MAARVGVSIFVIYIMSKLADEERGIHEKFKDFGRNAKEWMRKCVLLLPEIERLKIWEKKGFGSIFEYAAKIAGMSREKVNEGLRIMKKTENLPELRKVVEEKGIWAVSPVVCIATPENDRELAQKARGMSKNTLEVYAKGIRGSGGALPRKSGVLPLFTMSADLTEVADVESLLIVADSEVCWKLKKLKG